MESCQFPRGAYGALCKCSLRVTQSTNPVSWDQSLSGCSCRLCSGISFYITQHPIWASWFEKWACDQLVTGCNYTGCKCMGSKMFRSSTSYCWHGLLHRYSMTLLEKSICSLHVYFTVVVKLLLQGTVCPDWQATCNIHISKVNGTATPVY